MDHCLFSVDSCINNLPHYPCQFWIELIVHVNLQSFIRTYYLIHFDKHHKILFYYTIYMLFDWNTKKRRYAQCNAEEKLMFLFSNW